MPFAEELIGAPTVRAMIKAVHAAASDATLTALRAAQRQLPPLALRQRADLLRDALLADLPGDYRSFADTMRRSSLHGWMVWPVTSAVAAKAIEDGGIAAFDDALALLAELTGLLTAEFALRGLLNHDLRRALDIIEDWTSHESADVRRLASEGTRPLLPWSVRVPGIVAETGSTLPILHALYRDESEYVRRSVANHLNDLSRSAPDLVVTTARAWLAAPDGNTERLVRHGLRTLVKQGHPGALGLLGFAPAQLEVRGPRLADAPILIGGNLTFSASVRNLEEAPARLVIDYIVHHRKANGSSSGKTFKFVTRTLAPGEVAELSRTHSFRVLTTRRYYPGEHAIELQINGVSSGRAEFDLLPETET